MSMLAERPIAVNASVIDDAVARAAAFQREWGETSWDVRAGMLDRARGILLKRADEVAKLIASEQGKPVTEALTAEIVASLDALKFCAGEARSHLEEVAVP